MNVLVTDSQANNYHFRPDSSLIRDSRNLYLPPFLKGVKVAMALGFRINRPAKCIKEEFAHRYTDIFYPGLVFYGVPVKNEQSTYKTETIAFNFSTYLSNVSYPLDYNFKTSPFVLEAGKSFPECFDSSFQPSDTAYSLLCKYSTFFLLKIGDIILHQSALSDCLIPGDSIKMYAGDITYFDLSVK